ncbi:MAG: SDR family NAD(P)-dependent oxidoreductase [Acidimicrobiales bacterium]|nr:SDR family NAD(P)-dependent oxidoreductase [Acidimicrobiales bacterium]MYB81616.1 SDR family NAD(P)-dependent oxidoreductase [Acidimicrobiales bacterium]MYI13069.1 SDR family NAD(P)-dependent oxidoreductase [Acidimicrobiales bacterium]MYI28404.1 SDR family NAD(P)-dependent oxidoreductase [Acidimicrobiales bacterium]
MTVNKWTEEDIPDQSGRVTIVTGANSGNGLETARALAGRGAHVVLAVRDLAKGEAAVAGIEADHPAAHLELVELDLALLDSVRSAAAEIRDRFERIDLLVNNAGVFHTPRRQTADGFEIRFGTNHLGHFALTGLLLDRLAGTPGSRIVTVSSNAHRYRARIDFDRFGLEQGRSQSAAYGRSKLANLLFTYELQRRLEAAGSPAVALAAHPGWAATEILRDFRGIRFIEPLIGPLRNSAATGALATLRAATDPAAAGGEFYGSDGWFEMRGHPVLVGSSDRSRDAELQRQVWAASENVTGVTFPI